MARRFLREHLTEWGVDDAIIDTAQLCLSELVNNVIMHAHATSELALHLDDSELSVVLKDRGGAQPPVDTPTRPSALMTEDELIVAGRGLVLVDALVDRWGTERNEVGTTAWFVSTCATPWAPPRPADRPLRTARWGRRNRFRPADTRARRTDFWVCTGL